VKRNAADPAALMSIAQMQEADRLTVEQGTPGTALMERAGAAVAREIRRRFAPCPVAILCGPGNNGGDGFVVARALADAGWPARVALAGARERLRGDARHHADLWRGEISPLRLEVLDGAALVVDALFGSGLSRPLDADVAGVLSAAAERHLPVVAVDVPSGVAGDTGENLGGAIRAEATVTFTRKKPAHTLFPGRELCGEVTLADIGTPEPALERIPIDAWENGPALWRAALPLLAASGNKFSRGHALLRGGYPTSGAARMAARAAARAGAGLTTIAVSEEGLAVYAAALTSIMVRPLAGPADLDRLLADARYNALLIGPGAGVNETTRADTLAMLATGRPTVLDADAISVFAHDPPTLFDAIRGACVLTPHEGEFARLFGSKSDEAAPPDKLRPSARRAPSDALAPHGRSARGAEQGGDLARGDKLSRARAAARRSGAVLVLKGADTVIAAPDGGAIINTNAPPTLATAGSGDVLGGFILGLLAQGMPAFPAAAAAVWMHGAAAAEFGPGLLAEDLPDLLPAVLRRLLAGG
jgi:ADP-dependent NAD(P)H-hydrate dehydratase / NAD(P)H-hydrate epimerase